MSTPSHTDPSAIISRDVELPEDISEVELRQYELETELQRLRDTVRHLGVRCAVSPPW